jgi:hypothetical protein
LLDFHDTKVISLSKLLSGKHYDYQTTKKNHQAYSLNILLEVYADSLDQNQPSLNEVNVRLRKLTKDYGDFEIIQPEIENAANYRRRSRIGIQTMGAAQ